MKIPIDITLPATANSAPGVSIIICCYNSADRIGTTLEHLFLQQFESKLDWEIIIVDNNCSDATVETVEALLKQQSEGHPSVSIVEESRPGLSYAREKGVAESRYDIIMYCDDDNHLAADYVETGYRTISDDAKIGVLGGIGYPVFESEKPFWFDTYMVNYATGIPYNPLRGEHRVRNSEWAYGASVFIRKELLHFLKSSGMKSILSDRKGKSLSSGGDYEMFLWIYMIGYRVTYSDKLSFGHFIPADRSTLEYLYNLTNALGQSTALVEVYQYIMGVSYDIVEPKKNIGKRVARHYIRKLLRLKLRSILLSGDKLSKIKYKFAYLSLKGRNQGYLKHNDRINDHIREKESVFKRIDSTNS